ncbi:SS-A/Ro ribonucleoprotein, partial [Tetrabaena socialis]
MCARFGDTATRRAALAALPAVCRMASTLFEFVQRCKELGAAARHARQDVAAAADPAAVLSWVAQAAKDTTAADDSDASGGSGGKRGSGTRPAVRGGGGKAGWGRAMRRAVSNWYLGRTPAAVAYQATKYSQRNGWSHADLLRLAHPDPEAHAAKRRKLQQGGRQEQRQQAAAPEGEGEGAADSDGSDSDTEWVVVPPAGAAADGEGGDDGGAASEQVALAAAVAAAAAALAAAHVSEGFDPAEAAAAAKEALCTADMQAVFAFLTHGTLPGREPRARGRKAAPAAAGEAQPAGAAAAAVEGSEDPTCRAPPTATDSTTDADADADSTSPEWRHQHNRRRRRGAHTTITTNATIIDVPTTMDAAASDALTTTTDTAAPTAAAAAVPLSPVVQYLLDAHRLRKEIRAPPPLVKAPKPERQPAGGRGRGRGRGRGNGRGRSSVAEAAAPAAAPAPPPPTPEAAAAHAAAHAAALGDALCLVRRHRFGHEHVGDTQLLRSPELWAAFLEGGMPLTALVRNLGRMTGLGVMARPDCLQRVTARLTDPGALAAARVHPMALLEALATYRKGAGQRGVAAWEPVAAVAAALEAGFYLAFKNVVPTGQRYLIGLDVSGSMGCAQCAGMSSLSAREAAAAVCMSLVRSEPWVRTMAFSHELVPMSLTADDRLEAVMERASAIPMGGTDCALPMLHALEARLPVDVFVILTDNETWFGGVHPTQALARYRAGMGLPAAKLVVLAFSVTQFSIADPADPGMLDVAG